MARVAGPGQRQRHSPGGRGAGAGPAPCLLQASPKAVTLGRHPPPHPRPWAQALAAPETALHPNASALFCFCLFLTPLLVGFWSISVTSITSWCVCTCIRVCAHACCGVSVSLCCANTALCPGQPLVPPPMPAPACPRLAECRCSFQEPLVQARVHAFEDVESWVSPELWHGKQVCGGRGSP